MSDIESQTRKILKSMLDGARINGIYALAEFGCFRLPARIKNIEELGYQVKRRWIRTSTNKRVKEYWLEA